MKQRYNKLTHNLCVQAVLFCFDRKWHRNDVQGFINHYAGISSKEFCRAEPDGSALVHLEAADAIAYYLEEVMEELLDGEPLDMREVLVRPRTDGMSGKVRDICDLCLLHQLLGHLCKLGLDPLFRARILPIQFASLPNRGQTGLMRQVQRYLRRKSLGIKCVQKTDVYHAYGSLQYSVIINLIEKDIPSAHWILTLLRSLATYAPDGHLIIGGYLDAWLFNYAMSYALRFLDACGKYRRGKRLPYVERTPSYMDDFSLLGRSKSDLEKAVKKLDAWFRSNLGIRLQLKEHLVRFMSYEQERTRKHQKNKGCPCLDVGGYKIHRGYTTIRPRIFIRLRRQFLRAWREIQANGTFRLGRANKIIAYYGYLKQTDSAAFCKEYHVAEIVKMARRIKSFWARRFAKNLIRKDG